MPILPLMSTAIYPMGAIALTVGLRANMKLIEDVVRDDTLVALVPTTTSDREKMRPQEVADVGVASRIIDLLDQPGGSRQVTFQGIERVKIRKIVQEKPYLVGLVSPAGERSVQPAREELLVKEVLDLLTRLVHIDRRYGPELIHIVTMNTGDPGRFADITASYIQIDLDLKKKLMSTLGSRRRLSLLRQFIQDELEKVGFLKEFETRAENRFEELNRKKVLMEQLRAIKRELGDVEPQEEMIERIRRDIDETRLPVEIRSIIDWELKRLRLLPITTQDFRNVTTYIDWLLNIPWAGEPARPIRLRTIENVLRKDYHGIMNVKERILEILSPLALEPGLIPPVLCIVGPPATGKTSIAQSLADALDREFAKFSVSNCRSDADIMGTMRGIVGESPGMVVRSLRNTGTKNLLMVLEDVDEISESPVRGNPIEALLELFDEKRRSRFVDRYLNTPIDLSNVFFVATAKVLWDVPEAIRAKVKAATIIGYTEREKIRISRHFLIPRELSRAGIDRKTVRFSVAGLRRIIREYTNEGGLRQLQNAISLVATRCAYEKATGRKRTWQIKAGNVSGLIGPPRYPKKKMRRRRQVGVANGLAWTSTGGDLLIIEALRMPGAGELILTGQLGEVMQESVQAAHSYIRSKALDFGIEPSVFSDFDIHIHFPEGAIPKDGPSAGVSVATVIASVLGNIPIHSQVAMTGEVTLSGKVIGIGGLTEKLMAAYRWGFRKVIFPAENEADLKDVPDEVRSFLEFIMVSRIDEVLANALVLGKRRRRKKQSR